tara:strand:- start:168 stop:545 length:378 start_codon:yes stop_codon:yes gene_type:complete
MKSKSKQILVVGDRLLVQPDKGDKTSPAGLYLPPSVVEKQEVKGGIVVEVGPGIPLGSPNDTIDEPWKDSKSDIKYIPTQAEIGDYALYLGKASIEIEIEKKEYLIVPQSAILILIRDDIDKIVS